MQIIDIRHLDIPKLVRISVSFFSTCGSRKLLGRFNRFDNLIEECGYPDNPEGFFKAVFSNINARKKEPTGLNQIDIPLLYIYHLLEAVLPGNGLYSIHRVDQLETRAFYRPQNPQKVQKVIDQFPVRLSDHVIRQSLVSGAVAKQYLPFAQELDDTGHLITFDGHFKNGVVEQMYQNRVIFLLDMHCPVYCRFCFRKHKDTRKEKTPSTEDVQAAVDHVKNHPSIHEILITGGEPLLNRSNMQIALDGLMPIDHVHTIRIATRSVAYYPELFLKDNRWYIEYLINKNAQYLDHGKRIEVGVHFVHPDEICVQSLDIISRLVKNGIQVYVQTPFLGGVNTHGKTLASLFTSLRQAGAQIYYIFTPCHTIHGTKEYWSPIVQSFEAQSYLREHVSDRCVPKLCTATALGKIEWNTSGWAVEKDKENPEYSWIRTPYTLDYFEQFTDDPGQMPDFRENLEGTLDAKFRLDMGDPKFYYGTRSDKRTRKVTGGLKQTQKEINGILRLFYEEPSLRSSITAVPSPLISRTHKTCLEIKIETEQDSVWLEYLKNEQDITDVILHWEDGSTIGLDPLGKVIKKLAGIWHVVCVRIRSTAFSTTPRAFTFEQIETLSQWSDFSMAKPLRIEIESWFLLPEQITDKHTEVTRMLINRGINVYANSVLFDGLNDQPDTIVELAHSLRKAKIEFHHLYVAGLDIQKKYSCVPDPQKVVDIASMVRTHCSGRQIPLYIIQTPHSEIDFGLDSDV